MKIIFLGDITLNGQYIEYRKKDINPFSSLCATLKNPDFVIGNLESIAKGDQGENLLKKPRLTTTLETLGYLKDIHLDVACLAQNHVYDHLEDGFVKTTSFLKDNNIKHLGAGHSAEEAARPVILKKGNTQIGLLNYVTQDTNPKLPADAAITPNFFEEQRAIKEIAALKKKIDHVVLLLHWGGRVEGGLYPDYHQPRLARILIDAGADLVIGHHSHTFQPYEKYNGKYIFYSLGNFCFSDYWFEGDYRPQPKRQQLSGIVEVKFSKSGYCVETRFYRNLFKNFKRIEGNPIKINNLIFSVIRHTWLFWLIYFFFLKNILPFWFFIRRKDINPQNKARRILNRIRK